MARSGRTRTSRPSSVALGVGIGFAVLMLVAALQGYPQVRPIEFSSGGIPMPETSQQTTAPLQIPEDRASDDLVLEVIATVVGILIGLFLLVVLVRVIVRALKELWRRRALERRSGAEIGRGEVPAPAPVQSVDAPVVRDGILGAIDALQAHAAPSDAIVAAWVGLEESAQRAGMRRAAAETPGEFTLRVVGSRPGSGGDVRELLRMYEAVRYGDREPAEQERVRARELLERIHREWS